MKQRTRKLLTLLLIAAMVMSLMVPALAADTAQSETPYTYDAGDYTFGKISHPNSAPGQPDGLVDYTGNGTVAVTGTADGADGQGDRGQSYAWAAMAYGDYVYVGTCYAAMGNTLSAMDTVMGHKFDEETMRAELNAIFNGTFFYGQEDGGNSGGVLVKVNVHTGEMTLLMSKSLNGIAPLFRNAIRYKDKLYFCGSVSTNGRGGLPSIYEIDPSDDSITCVYQGLSNMQEYAQAYKAGVCTGIRGMAVYDGKLVISNVGVDGGYLLISEDPSKGFKKIATQSDLYNYPAVHYKDSVYGGGIWEIAEYNGSLYVAMCTGTPPRAWATICARSPSCAATAPATGTTPTPGRGRPSSATRPTVRSTPSASTRRAPAPRPAICAFMTAISTSASTTTRRSRSRSSCSARTSASSRATLSSR